MKILKSHFGKKLKQAIQAKGLKDYQFAEKVGVEPPTVSRWINGKDTPEDWRSPKICEVLGVTEDYFVESESLSTPAKETLGALSVDEFIQLSEKIQKRTTEKSPSMGPEHKALYDLIMTLTPEQAKIYTAIIRRGLSRRTGKKNNLRKARTK